MSTSVAEKIDVDRIMYGQENRLLSASPLPGHCVQLVYSDGASYNLDLKPLIARGGIAAELNDDAVFNAVRVVRRGTALEFSATADFCADSLRVDCEYQKAGYPDPWALRI